MIRFALSTTIALLLAVSPALAQIVPSNDTKPLGTITPEDGDRIVIIGDSITYQCLWSMYVENYLYTRFPDKRLHIQNVAVGGDRAYTVLARFDKTISIIKPAPKYAFIMLGMNDGSYTAPIHQPKFNEYCANMTELIERLEAMGTKVIAIGPPYYDQRKNERAHEYYNATLAAYGAWLREMANDRGHAYVDVNGPMAQATVRGRAKDPAFALAKDGIHPQAPGQFVMATEVLEQLNMPSVVSAIELFREGSSWSVDVVNGSVEKLAGSSDGVTFTFHANALPWVPPLTHIVDGEAREGYELTDASHRLNMETLRVRDLVKPGRYELTIDGEPIGEYDRDDLAAGIELQDNANTPQYKQAATLVAANAKRNNLLGQYLKAWLMHGYHERDRLYIADPKNADNPDFAERKTKYEEWYDANEKHKWKHHKIAIELEAEIYTMNKPVPHRYELRWIGAGK